MKPIYNLNATFRLGTRFLPLFLAFAMSSGLSHAEQPGPVSTMASKLNPANWSMPKPNLRMPQFLVPQEEQQRIVERKDSLFTEVRKSAGNSWTRTKQTFAPLNPMNLFAGQDKQTPKDDSPGFFKQMFTMPKAEPEERIANVNDFLSQERPK